MNHQNFKSQEEINDGLDSIVVPSFPQAEATRRNLQRKTVGPLKMLLAGTAAFIGYADKSNHDAAAADPFSVVAAAAATSDAGSMSIDKPLTQEEINLKIDEMRVAYRSQFRSDLAKIDATTGQAKYMGARMLIVNLQREAEKAEDDFSIVAINELLLEIATIAGRYDVALHANAMLTPDIELYTPTFFEKEKKMLEDAKKHPLNAKVLATLADITKETKERDAVLEALKALAMNPNDADLNQKIGSYIFYERGFEKGFEQASVKGLNYLKAGNSPLDRILAAGGNDGIALWGLSLKESDVIKRKRIQMRSLAVYQADPSKYTSEQRIIFEDLIKKNPAYVETGSARVTISLVAAPEIKPVASQIAQESVDTKKNNWVDVLRAGTNPVQNILAGKPATVTAEGRWVLQPHTPVTSVKLQIPIVPNKNYDVRAVVGQRNRDEKFSFILPVGKGECSVHFFPGYVSIQPNDGTGVRGLPDKMQVELPKAPEQAIVCIKVRSNEDQTFAVAVEVNDKEVATKTMEEFKIGPDWKWVISGSKGGAQSLGVTTTATDLELIDMKVNLLDGYRPAVQVPR